MAVLIAVGTTAAYSFSVLLTFLGSADSYYEAAALITFVLFGHWMEMKSRRGQLMPCKRFLTLYRLKLESLKTAGK